ncbi:hypothetical protein JHK85_028190 [Glycine max]|nr:hypothetical protein JHK85_028190 [Glycine max]
MGHSQAASSAIAPKGGYEIFQVMRFTQFPFSPENLEEFAEWLSALICLKLVEAISEEYDAGKQIEAQNRATTPYFDFFSYPF